MPRATVQKTKKRDYRFLVSAWVNGKQSRHYFVTYKEAKAKEVELNKDFAREGSEAVFFGSKARAEYGAAVEKLNEVGTTLAQAVDFYLSHHPTGAAVPFGDAVDALLDAKRLANRRPESIDSLRRRLATFAFTGNIQTLVDVTPDAVRKFISQAHLKPKTRVNYRIAISTLCGFAKKRGWMSADPLASIDVPTLDAAPARIFTPEQAARLMTAAAHVDGGVCVRAVALRLLAGLRPAEVDTLTDDAIRETVIRVSLGKIRGRRAIRLVPISPVLRAWLDLYPDAPLNVSGWRYKLARIKSAARLQSAWGPDICRKTWISYRLAETNDEALVSREAGNSPDVIYRTYFELVDAVDVRRLGIYSVLLPRVED